MTTGNEPGCLQGNPCWQSKLKVLTMWRNPVEVYRESFIVTPADWTIIEHKAAPQMQRHCDICGSAIGDGQMYAVSPLGKVCLPCYMKYIGVYVIEMRD